MGYLAEEMMDLYSEYTVSNSAYTVNCRTFI
jgi:hypothetical protein